MVVYFTLSWNLHIVHHMFAVDKSSVMSSNSLSVCIPVDVLILFCVVYILLQMILYYFLVCATILALV